MISTTMMFDKRDLKTGMIVEIYDGRKYIVTRVNGFRGGEGIISNARGFILLSAYDDSMKLTERERMGGTGYDIYDIMYVLQVPEENWSPHLLGAEYASELMSLSTEIIWGREQS